MPTGATIPTTADLRGTAGADRTVHNGGRARGSSSDDEGGGVLLQPDIEAGLQRELRQRATVHRQYVGAACRRQPYLPLQSSRKVHRAEILFRAKAGEGGQDQHPLGQDRGSPGKLGHQAPSPRSHHSHEFKTLNDNRLVIFNREAVIFLREEYLRIHHFVFAHFVVFTDVHVH